MYLLFNFILNVQIILYLSKKHGICQAGQKDNFVLGLALVKSYKVIKLKVWELYNFMNF